MNKSIVYYTDNRLDQEIMDLVQKNILQCKLPVVSVSLKPIDFGKNIVLDLERGSLAMFKQILAGLEASEGDYIFLCEHDVIYTKSHFDFTPTEDKIYFNTNVWKWKWGTDKVVWTDNLCQLSGVSGSKKLLMEFVKERIAAIEGGRDGHYEPSKNTATYQSKWPNLDIRHDKNKTSSKWSPDDFRNKKYAVGWKESTIDKIC